MNKRPVIGIIARTDRIQDFNVLSVFESYRNAIIKSGGTTILVLPPQLVEYNEFEPKQLPPLSLEEKDIIIQQLKLCDGVLLPGGLKRYEYDRFITDYCLDNDVPILGICLGMQLLATHINRDTLIYTDDKFRHSRPGVAEVHSVKIDKSSLLFNIIGEEEIKVNSRHKYMVTETGNFSVVAYSPDGVIEAIEDKSKKFAIGVEWHPENLMYTSASQKLFKAFIESCRK